MDNLSAIREASWLLWLAAGVFLLAVIIGAWWMWRRYQAPNRELERRFKRHAHAVLDDIIVPDGMDGQIHINYLLLTRKGLLVVDMLNIQGTVFGAPAMDEWMVMQKNNRHAFRNPLYGLQDRVAAIKNLADGVSVEGQVVFCRGALFPKGLPEGTLRHDALSPAEKNTTVSVNLTAAWQRIEQSVYLKK